MKARKLFSSGLLNHIPCKAILIAFVLLTHVTASAQNETKNWFFGDRAALNFSAGPPVALYSPTMVTNEGTAAMSDQNGNLLFYTDGITIWNKNHQPMPNGTGLLGHSSATQSALIVPWPGKACQKYFVFTVGAVEDSVNIKLHYSVVDMTLAGGLGDVVATSKNVVLNNAVAEKLTAVRDAAGSGFWVIVHGFDLYAHITLSVLSSQFYAYHIDAGGLNTTPVTSTAGTSHAFPPLGLLGNSWGTPGQGQMKVSPDGKLIACAVRYRFVEILNFSNATGQVTGPARTFNASSPPFQTEFVYGLEFSPNSKLLYVTTTGGTPNQLLQLDFTASTPVWTQLFSSTGPGNYYDTGQLQLGPDKKVYVARSDKTYLSFIDSPNTAGSGSNFVNIGVTLQAVSKLGLPNMISGNFSCTGTAPTEPTTSAEGCCDTLSAIPSWQPKAKLDLRTFTITNNAPASPICSIDISFNPPVPAQGSLLSIDGVTVPPSPLRFIVPYNRIPNAGAPTISAINSVKFTLGVSYTAEWIGTVTFVVNHCNNMTCTITYGPWSNQPPPKTAAPGQVGGSNLMIEGRFSTLRFQLLPGVRKRPVKWIRFSIDDSQGQLFAGTGLFAGEARGFPSTEVRVEDIGLDRASVLYTFAQPLKSGEVSGMFELVLSRASNAVGAPAINWTTYDANGNAIETGTITSQQGIFNIPR